MTVVSPSAFATTFGSAEYKSSLKQTASSESFAGLLDDPAAFLQPRQLFAFDALGMFGRSTTLQSSKETAPEKATAHATQSPSSHNVSHRHVANSTSPQAKAALSFPQTATGMQIAPPTAVSEMSNDARQVGSPSGYLEPGEMLSGSDEASPSATQNENLFLIANQSSTLAESDAASIDADTAPSVPENNGTDPPAALALANKEANPISLLVSGSPDALVIAARSPAGSALDFVKLRQLVEDTAAEFGMDIADFRLNGAASDLPLKSIAGGQHGSRTR